MFALFKLLFLVILAILFYIFVACARLTQKAGNYITGNNHNSISATMDLANNSVVSARTIIADIENIVVICEQMVSEYYTEDYKKDSLEYVALVSEVIFSIFFCVLAYIQHTKIVRDEEQFIMYWGKYFIDVTKDFISNYYEITPKEVIKAFVFRELLYKYGGINSLPDEPGSLKLKLYAIAVNTYSNFAEDKIILQYEHFALTNEYYRKKYNIYLEFTNIDKIKEKTYNNLLPFYEKIIEVATKIYVVIEAIEQTKVTNTLKRGLGG